MKTIQIKDSKVKFDSSDYDEAVHYKWYITKKEVYTKINGKKISLSKLIFNIKPNYVIMHKNNDSFDFTRNNILIIPRSEFARYIKREKKSIYNNVHWDISKRNWIVNIDKDNKRYFGGRYSIEKEAGIVADYLNLQIYKTNVKNNFTWENDSLLIEAYNEILDKYGETTTEKISIGHQGIILNKDSKNTSKYVGVHRNNRKQKWVAEIKKYNKRYFLGYFENEIDAAKAYDKKALELYGENAKVNIK